MVRERSSAIRKNKWISAAVLTLAGLACASLVAFGQTSFEPARAGTGTKALPPDRTRAEAKAAAKPTPAPNLVTYIPSFDPANAQYVLLAWSDSGMRMVSDCDQRFSLEAPFTNLRAQLIKRGQNPALVTEGVTLTYAVERMASPAAKSRYWDLSQALRGQKLAPDTGPSGNAQRGTFKAEDKIFSAEDVPVMPYAADGSFLPYPTVAVEARDAATGQVLAMTRAVLPATTQLSCAKCHGGDQSRPGISLETASRILTAHDKNSGTKLLAEAKAGHPRACASCHGQAQDAKAALTLSASLHGFHAGKLKGLGSESCAFCHPVDSPTHFYRGVHAQRGLDCARCHGLMEDHALGLLKAEQAAGKKSATKLMAGLEPRGGQAPARTAWAMEPDCQACHDFVTRPKPDALALGKWNQDAAGLYHKRKDLANGLACAACHSPAHAIYPALNPYGRDRDNIQPVQYMGQAKAMGATGNCVVCHTVQMDPQASVHHPIPRPVGTTVAMAAGFDSRMPGVLFPHQAHADQGCRTCHHKGYVDGQSLSCSTAGCHDQKSGEADARYFRNAFHGPGFSCNYCHQQRRKAGQASGPVECGGCHVIAR